MGTMTVKSVTKTTKADYENSVKDMKIILNYNKDGQTEALLSMNGTVLHLTSGEPAGNFNGVMNNGEMEYTFSGLKRADMIALEECLEDIEQQITTVSAGSGEE